jgi:DNA-binding XRE family transcriptional regulator
MKHLTPKATRLMRKKTQKECAEALHVHVSTFRRLEKDPSQFTIEQAKKLCVFLGIEFDVMFFN